VSGKTPLGKNVLTAARERIAYTFDHFERVCVSFSGGKDSSVMLHLVMDEAVRRDRVVGVLLVDLEGQYKLTIDHAREMIEQYRNNIDLYWICLPIALRNAVSVYEPKWMCWEPGEDWIRQPPPEAIIDESYFPFFRRGMEFEEFVPEFGRWYSQDKLTACFVGIRADESLNRYRTIKGQKSMFQGVQWTTYTGGTTYNVYPVYDWRTADIWRYNGRYGKPYNRLYDLMHKAGLSIHQQRICQPYGDDQRKGLWLFHVIEPETWSKIVARVNGANSGAEFVQYSGNVSGQIKVSKPNGHTWESFAKMLLASLPKKTREHFESKIAVFIQWWIDRGYPRGIPDEADPTDEAEKKAPSWRRICKMLLRNDYWAKGLSFSQTKAESYEKYRKIQKKRRQTWNAYRLLGRTTTR
jgi:predicted phosphoadenosine phosphosulfate sulfurtransferase